MNVILLNKIKGLGDLGETVTVKAGYGRNYLVPKGLALPSTNKHREVFESRKADLMQKVADSLNAAKLRAQGIDGQVLTITAQAADEGKLYGSVGVSEVLAVAHAAGIKVERSEIDLGEGPIRHTGEHKVRVILHPEVDATMTVNVVSTRAAAQAAADARDAAAAEASTPAAA